MTHEQYRRNGEKGENKMFFCAEDDYKEVSLEEGLNALQMNKDFKLYSDGLETDEYIYFDFRKGFCYEDGCVIGGTFDMTIHRLISLKWVLHHNFYIKQNKENK